jgi:acetolactate synthase-1/2/3 large subunit
MEVHGGRIVAEVLKSRGVDYLFTLSGGHLFSIYDGCKAVGIDLIDVRHEQTAAFAAEGLAKATRGVGVAALTAGPGVTNGLSAIAGAQANGSPLCVLGGRAPELRWGSGSLQEIDHLPFVSPLVKSAQTVKQPDRIAAATAAALDLAASAPSGPTFVDYPLDVVFTEAELDVPVVRRGAAGGWSRTGGGAAGRGRAAGDHGRQRPLLGPRRGRDAGTGRGARDPRLPQRARPGMSAGRP